ncbi:MAG TPA: HAMP domain-containing sensor histidine kinase [Thermoanaerobaculia bacterium]|jgi:signal transduction histidine kinase|nr:HAMP domain-containing sensor histidine kinase [Thermoanaerobaculia bacterium]
MRRIFRRSILWLLPVVIIPLGALLILQVRFLRALESKTASAERNWQRNSLEMVTSELESQYRTASALALSRSEAQIADVSNIGRHFGANHVPGARTFFSMNFKQDMYDVGFFDAHGQEKHASHGEADAVKMATVSWHVAHKWNRVAEPQLYVDERDPKNRIILRPIVDASWHVVGVTGVILDEGLSKAAMTTIGNRILKTRHLPHNAVSLRVADRFPRASGGRDYVTQPIGFVFTNWRAGIRDLCASPEEVAATHFRNNMMWTGGAFVVLLGAVGLSVGAVARQMRLSQMKSDFVSNVSHELRTPLSSIRVFGEYMRLGRVEKPEKIREYGEYIEAESRRLTQLINNILDFSRIESAEKKYHFCETDVVELVEQTVGAFEVPLREHGLAVSFHAGPVPMLQLDKDAIAQVLVNLLDNAVKYSNGRKDVAVTVEALNDEVRIAVRDRGIGIPIVEQKKIYEKFYRVGSTLVHDVKGSGLGLSIVMHVVKAHGGRVELLSVPGEGSTFTIVLPLQKTSSVPIASTEYA